MKRPAKEAEAARRSQSMPSVGQVTVLAIETFRNGALAVKHLTAWWNALELPHLSGPI